MRVPTYHFRLALPQLTPPRIQCLSPRLLVAVVCALMGLAASAGSALAYVPAAESFAPVSAPVVLRSIGATVADTTPPTVTAISLASASRTAATYSVTFSEVVTGVTSAKLTLGGSSTGWTIAASVTGSGAGPYVFTLANATSGGLPLAR